MLVDKLQIPKEYSLLNVGITQSMLSNWTCRVKFLMCLWRLKQFHSGRTTYFGSWAHAILELIYKYGMQHHVLPTPEQVTEWVNDYYATHHDEFDQFIDNVGLVIGTMDVLMRCYCLFYADEFRKFHIIGVEGVFDTVWHGTRLRGMMDGRFRYIGKHGVHGKPWLLEHKTMGNISEEKLLARLGIDKQNLFYITAAENMFNDIYGGVLYNIIRRPKHKPKSGQSVPDFLAGFEKEVLSNPNHFFIRYPVAYTIWDKQRFKKQLRIKLNDIRLFLLGKLPVYRNEDACESSHQGSPYLCDCITACTSNTTNEYEQGDTWFPELEGR